MIFIMNWKTFAGYSSLMKKYQFIKDQMPDAASSFWALAYLEPSEDHIRLYAAVYQDGQKIEQEACVSGETPDLEKECERELAVLLFTLLTKLTQITPTWGILTGVRPIKLMRRLTSELEKLAQKLISETNCWYLKIKLS